MEQLDSQDVLAEDSMPANEADPDVMPAEDEDEDEDEDDE